MKTLSAKWFGALVLLGAGAVVWAANPKLKDGVSPPEVDIFQLWKAPMVDGVEVRALSVAYVDFERRGHDVAGYDVRVLRRQDDFVISVSPPFEPGDQTVGQPRVGIEIVYVVAKDGRLLKVQLGR
jgi:hypothetical protein